MQNKFLIVILLICQVFSQCSQNCVACNTQIQGCLYCKKGYTRNFINVCQKSQVEFCQLLDFDGNCFLCRQLFIFKDQTCIMQQTGCSIFQTSQRCAQCIYGTRLINGKCQGILNCAQYFDQNVCQQCYSGYQFSNNICRDTSAGCKQIREQSGVCKQCKLGYTMAGYMCVQNSKLIQFCQFYQPNDPQLNCFRCLTGFQYNINTRQCRMISFGIVENIQQQKQQNNIDDSFEGTGNFNNNQNQGESSTRQPLIQNDLSFSGIGGQTTQCKEGQILLTNGECKSIPIGCQFANINTGLCQLCHPQFQITNQNLCIDLKCAVYDPITGFCIQCFPGFIKDQIIEVCIDVKCQRIKEGICTKCQPGYYLPNNQLICHQNLQNCRQMDSVQRICLQCFQEYDNRNGFCQKLPQKIIGCIFQEDNICFNCQLGLLNLQTTCLNLFCAIPDQQLCQNCVDGFTLNQQKVCVDIFCSTYDKHLCINCVNGYGLDPTGKCVLLPQFCLQIRSNGICNLCIDGYQLVNNICTKIITIKNCIKANLLNPNQCIICEQRFYRSVTHLQCLKISDLCDEFNPQTGFCFNCNFGLIPQNGQCFDNNCQQFNADTNCIQCKRLYEINPRTGVCQNRDPSCLQVFNQKCQRCIQGYYLDKDDFCVQLPFGCRVVNFFTGKCLQCHEQFDIRQGTCFEKVIIQHCQRTNFLDSNQCQLCQRRYFLFQKACAPVSRLCQVHNPNQNFCLQCIQGYTLQIAQGKCKDINCQQYNGDTCIKCKPFYQILNNNLPCFYVDQNCKTLGNNRCLQCFQGYFVHSQGHCEVISQFCKQMLPQGICVSCVTGYNLQNGICIQILVIRNCAAMQGQFCLQCNDRYYLSQNTCNIIGNGCDAFDKFTGVCLTCFTGYQLNNTKCQLAKVINIQDPNCLQIKNGICQKCSKRFYYNGQKCVPVNPLCRDFNNITGACTSCYPFYQIQESRCILSPVEDPNCKIAASNGNCQECFQSFYSKNGKCQKINQLCKTYNKLNGFCLSCFRGYRLINGGCFIHFKDPNCRQFDSNEFCIKCANKYFISENKCTLVNPNCKNHDELTGACTQCYKGFVISGRDCIIGGQNIEQPNCKNFNGNVCLQCFPRFYVQNGKCKKVNPLCRNFSTLTGDCTQCYIGYFLNQGECLLGTENRDQNCKIFSEQNNEFCIQCYKGYIPINGFCTIRDDNCAIFSELNFRCQACYPGYELIEQGQCVILSQLVGDINCIQVTNRVCTKCADGFFKNIDNKCELQDPQCRSYNNFGVCIECFGGYILSNGKCLNPVQLLQNVPNCQFFDVSGFCSKCIDRYYLRDRQCHHVSILCGQYDEFTGKCLTCNSQFFNLQNDECVQLNSIIKGCSRYQGPFCAQCQPAYYYNSFNCFQIDVNCLEFDFRVNLCRRCIQPLKAQGTFCV